MTLTPQRALAEGRRLVLQAYGDLQAGEIESAASKVGRAAAFVEYAYEDVDGMWQGRLRLQCSWLDH